MGSTGRKHESHRERHKILHICLDELVADWITHTKGLPGNVSIFELMMWLAKQIEAEGPDHAG